ncbi:MAG: alpha/beta fold hydrolase [Pseudomonadales bacterium]|nr:alpha/beta fold hydrolase [Pseudomonadales bacterium]MCP5214339.1 alpha/beta fold hydrolase [Pseudomonadales bacterium]
MKLNFIHQGQGEPVILLHGLFGSLRNLSQVSKALAGHFSVYLLDMRNHGDSPHHSDMAFSDMADDVIGFMNAQQIKQAHLLGHSMGGKAAMQLALNHAERVNKLIVADIAPVTYSRRHDPVLKGLTEVKQAQPESRREADQLLAKHVLEPEVRAFLLKSLTKNSSGNYQLKFNLKDIAANYENIILAPSGNPFHGPTLFIKGSESAYIQAKHKETVLTLFPNASVKIIAGTGHWLHAEKPAIFNRIALNFLLNG